MKISINGKNFSEKSAKIPALDRGLLYGEAVFETMKAINGKVFMIEKHIERLFHSAKLAAINPKFSKKVIRNSVYENLKSNNLHDAIVRITLTGGTGFPKFTEKSKTSNLIIFSIPFKPYPEKIYLNGVEVKTVKCCRLHSEIKSTDLLPTILECRTLSKKYFEALQVDSDGNVLEGLVSNFFAVFGKKIKTPKENVLRGITRSAVIDAAKKSGFVVEKNISLEKVFFADECFLTKTSAGIVPVVKIDGKKIAKGKPGKITKKLIEGFRKIECKN